MRGVASIAARFPHLVGFWDVRTGIRDRLNAHSSPWTAIGDRRWQLANGALDAIDDANTAIWTYFEMDWPKGAGAQLLTVYGLFQAAVIQQDGVIELSAAMNDCTYKQARKGVDTIAPVLVKNRELRDRLVGHPANKSWSTGNPTAATFNRHLPDREHLSAAIYDINSGAFQKQDIAVVELIEGQAKALSSVLTPIMAWASNPK